MSILAEAGKGDGLRLIFFKPKPTVIHNSVVEVNHLMECVRNPPNFKVPRFREPAISLPKRVRSQCVVINFFDEDATRTIWNAQEKLSLLNCFGSSKNSRVKPSGDNLHALTGIGEHAFQNDGRMSV